MSQAFDLNDMLSDSVKLHIQLSPYVSLGLEDSGDRSRASQALASVAFEHAAGVIELMTAGKYTSAVGLLRLQYEALVRSNWVYFSASDGVILRLLSSDALSGRSEDHTKLGRMLDDMDDLAPASLMTSLREFREYSWKPLNSFVHAGARSVAWRDSGFPGWLLAQTICSSNGLLVFTCVHLASLAGDAARALDVVRIANSHPAITPPKRDD